MEQENIILKIMSFGLTRQETVIYVCLIQNGELSGYEAAKLTGISRSNVYSALAGLVEKGAAYCMEGATSKYTPVTLEEFCENKIRHLEALKNELQSQVIEASDTSDGYITISGYRNILDKVHHMILQTDKRLYLSAPCEFVEMVESELQGVSGKNKKVVILTDHKSDAFKEFQVYLSEKNDHQIRLITDSRYVLTGEITGSNQDTCLYSGQVNFVNVFKEALRNEIKLIELTKGESNE